MYSRIRQLAGTAMSDHETRDSSRKRLDGKVALVGGAARGIGEAIAPAFVDEGATVRVTDVDEALGEPVARSPGASAAYARLDLREEPR